METQTLTLEEAFQEQWQLLSTAQKELLLKVAKNFTGTEETPVSIPKEVMEGIWKDREDYMNGIGKTYSREEAREYILRNAAKK